MDTLFLDTETFSPVPINRGTYRYATKAEVMIATWARNNGPVQRWDMTASDHVPHDLWYALENPDVRIVAHNAIFDRTLLGRCAWYNSLLIPISRWHCMMHRAYAHGLPGKLEKLSGIFKLGAEGKIEGKVYMQMFCKPQADGRRFTRETHPLEWEGFMEYAAQDIVAMRALDRMMPTWNMTVAEHALYVLDQKRNDRGFAVDAPLAHAIIKTVGEESKKLADRTEEITEGEVQKTTQRNKLLAWLLAEHGVTLPDLKADTVERRLDDPELPESVKELLRIRQQASKASTAKAKRIVDSEVDNRMRGTIQLRGAQRTGRDAGRIFQPQNLPRPKHKQKQIDMAIEALKGDYLPLLVDDPIGLASSCLRGLIVAEPGNKLVVADLANIEGRMLAWLAGETWKLQAFREYDAGTGPDLYKLAYARAFNRQWQDVDKDMRQIGKVMELALGYGGGVGAFATMAVTYGIDLEEMAEKAWAAIPADVLAYARSRWQKDMEKLKGKLTADGRLVTPFDMAEKTYVVCQSLVTLWRKAHPATVQFWASLEEAVCLAIATPEHNFPVRSLVVDRRGNWLRIKLPSGRFLCYPSPKLDEKGISYAGVNQYTRQWARIRTYGGKIVENVDQAASADVLKDAELRAEAAGYNVVLPVHDEVVSEPPDDPLYNLAHLCSILATNSSWNAGLPLAAAGFEGYRYRKE